VAGGAETAGSAPEERTEERTEVDSLLAVADLVWGSADHPPPPLESDPTAIMLGLVPDPSSAPETS
jgi:hypothetical protein